MPWVETQAYAYVLHHLDLFCLQGLSSVVDVHMMLILQADVVQVQVHPELSEEQLQALQLEAAKHEERPWTNTTVPSEPQYLTVPSKMSETELQTRFENYKSTGVLHFKSMATIQLAAERKWDMRKSHAIADQWRFTLFWVQKDCTSCGVAHLHVHIQNVWIKLS